MIYAYVTGSLPLLGIISPSLHIRHQPCQLLRTTPHLLISPPLLQITLTQEAHQQCLGYHRMHVRQVATHVETDQENCGQDSQRDSLVDQVVLGYPVDDENGS
jgi:hypothetical protein